MTYLRSLPTGVDIETRGDPDSQDLTFYDAWVAALTILDLDVERAENLLRANVGSTPDLIVWTPPTGIGSLPLPLLERAQHLHRRQLEVAELLAAAMVGNRRLSALTDAIDATRPSARPVFIDDAC
ncbi:MAG TPA: hypothetical protein VMV52_08690 [Candidatus Nanopelagicaceae bacterium]|nr:hypothetical protein [Candidatus Nanopelagicaceae bacterium]